MDQFENILNECIRDCIDDSDYLTSQKYIELREIGVVKKIAYRVKKALKPTVVRSAEKTFKAVASSAKRAAAAAEQTKLAHKKLGKAAETVTGMAAVAFAMALIKKAKDSYRSMIHKRCSKFQDDELLICKIRTIDFTINELSSYKSDCKKTRNPEECSRRIDEAIHKLNQEKNKLKDQLINKRR